MINAMKEILRGTVQILLLGAVIKVFWNYLRFGTPFSKRRMMYNMAKFRYQQNGGKNNTQKPKDYYAYKVYMAEKRWNLVQSILGSIGKLSKKAVIKLSTVKSKNKKVEPVPFEYQSVDYSVFETYDPDCLQYMD